MNEITREMRQYTEEAPEGWEPEEVEVEIEVEVEVDIDQLAEALSDLQPDDGPDAGEMADTDLPF